MNTSRTLLFSPAAAARIASIGLFLLVMLAGSQARSAPIIQRYINFSVSTSQLDLGTINTSGVYDSPAELKVHVTANCMHSGVVASMTALNRTGGGGTIGQERLFVKLPVTGNYMPLTGAVAITGPMNPGVFDVSMKFRVQTSMADEPGEYTGTLTITCAPLP